MNKIFSDVQVLIWDFDKTLYPPNEKLFLEIREKEFNIIIKHKGLSIEQAKAEFYKIYKKITPSATEAIAKISNIPTSQAAVEMEEQYDRRKFLQVDPRLKELFINLSKFQHYILANGSIKKIKETLIFLGLPLNTFKEIITSETVGVNKPHLDGYKYIMQKTKLSAEKHLMIGDREMVDLVPAKKLGMKTCLVYSDKKSNIADVTFKDIYKLPNLLL